MENAFGGPPNPGAANLGSYYHCLDKYQDAAMRTRSKQAEEGTAALDNAILGLCGEAGEVADIIKKARYHGHMLDIDKITDEIGDILWYCALAAFAIGIPLGVIAERNITKLHDRYPNGFDSEKSKARYQDGGKQV